MNWIRNLFSKNNETDIDKYLNLFGEVYIHKDEQKTVERLDNDKISVHICDTEYKIIHASCDSIYDFGQYLGDHIYNIEPKDIATYLYNLHEIAQKEKQANILHLVINNHLVFVSVKPLILYNNKIFGSCALIIPYKTI
jgi:hypothetical protein